MQKKTRLFIRSVQSLVGAVIGVGIFGLPYVFSQSGFSIGLIYLVVLGGLNLMLLLMYADILMNSNGHDRLVGSIEKYLGHFWSHVTSVALFASIWGAMLAYIIIGGEFLHTLLSSILGGEVFIYQIAFFIISAFILIGGLGLVSRMEVAFVFTLLVLLIVIMAGAIPEVDLSNLATYNLEFAFLPFGVVFFAFGGIGTVPEMKEILGRGKRSLRKAILLAVLIISVIYLSFSGIVIGVTGSNTSEEAILGLGEQLGSWAVLVGSLIGLFAVFTSFLILGVQIMDTVIYDYKARYLTGWIWAISVPIILFLVGARSFIGVIGFTGGVFGVIIGLLILAMYKRAKTHVCTPKRCFRIPDFVIYFMGLILLIGLVATIVEVL